MKLVSIPFELDRDIFSNGVRKIAINFAIDNGVSFDKLEKVTVYNGGLVMKQYVIPFTPLTTLDKMIERYEEKDRCHSLVLFCKKYKLWYYIELFSTFKYYVLLNSN